MAFSFPPFTRPDFPCPASAKHILQYTPIQARRTHPSSKKKTPKGSFVLTDHSLIIYSFARVCPAPCCSSASAAAYMSSRTWRYILVVWGRFIFNLQDTHVLRLAACQLSCHFVCLRLSFVGKTRSKERGRTEQGKRRYWIEKADTEMRGEKNR